MKEDTNPEIIRIEPKSASMVIISHNGSQQHALIFLRDTVIQAIPEMGAGDTQINVRTKKEVFEAITLSRHCLYELCMAISNHLQGVEAQEQAATKSEGN